ncbi:ATP-dependent helicase/nuclease subunit A [Sedimentibacter acidaminivorans]|uniref:ATP-dependent helicase/nuclease subunit A n=1 Tax=Sedimentibacter acidaminivorans TaxID=913099 RepID=A0ABS4GEM2_9FIRM|nr:helicase-exonuclease AddAB subunit AddA [Sedimentibacter acidaminivorans]MBP1926087.1 ATP-dependent helicase/nuclease subunit A [Sedimentibacter acidaminivorans]
MEWTKEQKKIIELKNSNILVSAAAGSGKTAVLVERIINLVINENEDIDKFLIVTFTNAAANGMKQKIQKSLIKSIKSGEKNKLHLKKQLNLLNKANISTIHAFCIDIVRKNFHIIGIDPNFRIGDPNEIDILLQESLDEVLERAYTEKSESFIKLVEGFTKNRGDSELCEIIKDMYHFTLSFPNPLDWLKESVDMLKVDYKELESSLWMKAVRENASMLLDGAMESLKQAKELSEESDGPLPYVDALTEDLYNVENLNSFLNNDFERFVHSVHCINHPRLGQLRGKNKENCSEEKQLEVKYLRDEYKKLIDSIKKLIPNKTLEEFTEEINYMYFPMASLYDIVVNLSETFKMKKMEKAIADFSDVEHYALEILKNKEIGATYRKKYNYIFIDEYQDSNGLQETLIEQIKRENNVFMVGDVKQSIYRFRLADPSLFIKKYMMYQKNNEALETLNEINVRVDLMKNFRSRKEILDGTNYVFKKIMSEKIGEIEYTEESFLNSGTEFNISDESYIELDIIDKNTEDDEDLDDDIKSMKTAEIEAKFVVKKIKELVKQQTYIPQSKEFRMIEYKDIVILMRSVSNWSEIFEEVFEEEGIPFYFDGGAGYFETIEIKIIINLLKIIDNIRQDIPLLSVLRSPIGKFTAEELIKIRIMSPKLNYIEAVYAYKNKGNDYLSDKLQNFIEKVESWKKKSRYMHLNDFIWEILMETGYYYFSGVLPKGNIRQANLRLLTDKAFEFEKTSMRGLFNFLRYIEKLNVSSGNVSTAKTLGENDNVVRLMSVHKSKGLEFPVVLICGLNKKFNRVDIAKNILKHKTYGIAPKYINPDERIYKETFPRLALKNVVKVENLSEEMRVLYVAMTRAVDKLILIGTVNKIESKAKRWKKGSTQYNIYTSETFMDWICSSLYKHRDFKEIKQIFGDNDCRFEINDLSSKWKVNRLTMSDINYEDSAKTNDRIKIINEILEFKNKINSPYNEAIQERLNWRYEYVKSVNVPSKLSVTDLKMLEDNEFEHVQYKIPLLKDIPAFKENDVEFTKAEIGTIVHFVMQHLDLNLDLSYDNIQNQINEMIKKKLLTEKEANVVEVNKIVQFFNIDIGRRMKISPTVKREVPFVIKKKADEIITSLDKDDIILIQGIIDCYFYEGEKVVIIDYKTDDISQMGLKVIKEKYKPQILSYKEAVEKITNRKVKSCYLYLFDIGEAIEIKE